MKKSSNKNTNGTTKFYNDYFKSLDAKRYGQVRNNFSDSEDAFDYIGYQMSGWIVSECCNKVCIDNNLDKLVAYIYGEIGKFTKRERDCEGYFIDENSETGRINSVDAYIKFIVPKRLCNLNELSKEDMNLAGRIREIWDKYYGITNVKIAYELKTTLSEIDRVSGLMKGSLSLDYENSECNDVSLHGIIPDQKNCFAEVECLEGMHELAKKVKELQFKVIEKHGGGVVENEVLKQMQIDEENGTSHKNANILKSLEMQKTYITRKQINDARVKVKNWLAKDKEYLDYIKKLKEIFMKYYN